MTLVSATSVFILAGAAGCSGAPDSSPASETYTSTTQDLNLGNPITVPDGQGAFATYSTTGSFNFKNPFFQSLGTNGRSCATCHRLENGWNFSTATAQILFDLTGGRDPLFNPVDGTNTPNEDVSTVAARRQASSLLLNRGVIRIGLPLPANAEFTLVSISDPYNYATPGNLSLYRRPLMATNLKFVVGTSIMWDGREPNLGSQANDANLSHAQATSNLPADVQASIVNFESATFTAQTFDVSGFTNLVPSGGGPIALSQLPFALNANSPAPLPVFPNTLDVFTLYPLFANSASAFQQSVARGEAIFNFRPFVPPPPQFGGPLGTCSTCHASFNNGGNDHAGGDTLIIGTAGGGPLATPPSSQFLAADLPIYTFRNNQTGETTQVTDPGRALITGAWFDVGAFKVPDLRGVSAHPPFFHNGLAKTLLDVVNFYDVVFAQLVGLPFTDQEKTDLVNFLSTL